MPTFNGIYAPDQPLQVRPRQTLGDLLTEISAAQRVRRMDELNLKKAQMSLAEMRRARENENQLQTTLQREFAPQPMTGDVEAWDESEGDFEMQQLRRTVGKLRALGTPEAMKASEALQTKIDFGQQRISNQASQFEANLKTKRDMAKARIRAEIERQKGILAAQKEITNRVFTSNEQKAAANQALQRLKGAQMESVTRLRGAIDEVKQERLDENKRDYLDILGNQRLDEIEARGMEARELQDLILESREYIEGMKEEGRNERAEGMLDLGFDRLRSNEDMTRLKERGAWNRANLQTQAKRDIAAGNNRAAIRIAADKNLTLREIADERNLTAREIAEINDESRRYVADVGAESRETVEGMRGDTTMKKLYAEHDNDLKILGLKQDFTRDENRIKRGYGIMMQDDRQAFTADQNALNRAATVANQATGYERQRLLKTLDAELRANHPNKRLVEGSDGLYHIVDMNSATESPVRSDLPPRMQGSIPSSALPSDAGRGSEIAPPLPTDQDRAAMDAKFLGVPVDPVKPVKPSTDAGDYEKIKQDWFKEPVVKAANEAFRQASSDSGLEAKIEEDYRAGKPIALSQLTQIFGFVRSLDDSVVKAMELDLFLSGADNVKNRLNSQLSQTGLTDTQRRAFTMAASRELFDIRKRMLNQMEKWMQAHYRDYESNFGKRYIDAGLASAGSFIPNPYTPPARAGGKMVKIRDNQTGEVFEVPESEVGKYDQ